MPLHVSGNCVSDALDQLKTSPLFFNAAQGGAGELCLQRHPEPPPASLLEGWSRGAEWGRRDQQIRSAQSEAPRPTGHRHPAQTEGAHLRLWVRLSQTGDSSNCCVPLWNTWSLWKEPAASLSVLVGQPLARGRWSTSWFFPVLYVLRPFRAEGVVFPFLLFFAFAKKMFLTCWLSSDSPYTHIFILNWLIQIFGTLEGEQNIPRRKNFHPLSIWVMSVSMKMKNRSSDIENFTWYTVGTNRLLDDLISQAAFIPMFLFVCCPWGKDLT